MNNTFIGFCVASSKAYCRRCDYLFMYHWNSCDPFSEDYACPKCGCRDKVETMNFIDTKLRILQLFKSELLDNEEQKKKMQEEISDLNNIRKILVGD